MSNNKLNYTMKKAKVQLKKYEDGGKDTNYTGSNVANRQKKQDQAGVYGKAAGNALLTTSNQMYQPQDNYTLTADQNAQNTAINNSIDNTAASVTPWYGAAKGLSNIGKSQIKKDEYGDAVNNTGAIADDWLTPDHQLIMNGYQRNGVGGALFESFGFGKISRTVGTVTGNNDNTDGFWGWSNKMNGNTARLEAKQNLIDAANTPPPDMTPRNTAYYANGGVNMSPNAEVELQENSITPNGEFTQYDGASHEQGGIPTNLEQGEMVFSDKLKAPGTKKTFADLNKPFNTNKEDKVLEDKKKGSIQKATADLMKAAKLKQSMTLFEQQESLKEAKLASYAKRLGINSDNMFRGGGKKGSNNIYKPTMVTADDSYGMYPSEQNDGTGNLNEYSTELISQRNPNESNLYGNDAAMFNNSLSTQGAANYDNYIANLNKPSSSPQSGGNTGSRDYSQLINLGTTAIAGLAANAGNIYDLKRSKTVDKETYNRVTPELLDPSATIRYNNQVFAKGSQDVKNASNGNSSTYIQNRKDLAINQMLTNARIKQDYANQNAGITNQSKYYNAGIGDKETIANLMNQAQARNIKGAAIGAIGNNVSNSITGSVRDVNATQRDKDYLRIIAAKYPEIMKDPELAKLYK